VKAFWRCEREGTHQSVLIAGVSGLVAGAMSMAAGEYVSVSSQSNSERADIGRERQEPSDNRDGELRVLAGIYVHLERSNGIQTQERDREGPGIAASGREQSRRSVDRALERQS
jgi:VIT1/CCC1 family predicted Fe2+/Mn2+ transporter